jgi:hypothetical protein
VLDGQVHSPADAAPSAIVSMSGSLRMSDTHVRHSDSASLAPLYVLRPQSLHASPVRKLPAGHVPRYEKRRLWSTVVTPPTTSRMSSCTPSASASGLRGVTHHKNCAESRVGVRQG